MVNSDDIEWASERKSDRYLLEYDRIFQIIVKSKPELSARDIGLKYQRRFKETPMFLADVLNAFKENAEVFVNSRNPLITRYHRPTTPQDALNRLGFKATSGIKRKPPKTYRYRDFSVVPRKTDYAD